MKATSFGLHPLCCASMRSFGAIVVTASTLTFGPGCISKSPLPPRSNETLNEVVAPALRGIHAINSELTKSGSSLEAYLVSKATNELQCLARDMVSSLTNAMKSEATVLNNRYLNAAKSGYQVEVMPPISSSWIMVAAICEFCEQNNADLELFVIQLKDGLNKLSNNGNAFADQCFQNAARSVLKNGTYDRLPSYFIQHAKDLSAEARESLVSTAIQNFLLASYETHAKSIIDSVRVYNQARVLHLADLGVHKNPRFTTQAKLQEEIRNYQLAEKDSSLSGRKRRNTVIQKRSEIIAGVQHNSVLEATDNYIARNAKGAGLGSFDSERCIAEIFIAAGGLSVKKCDGDILRYQLLLPYFVGFNDEQVRSCYQIAFGTPTPDSSTKPATDQQIASALLSVFEQMSRGKSFTPALGEHFLIELIKAALSDSSAEIKGIICLAEVPGELSAVGFRQLVNFLNLSSTARFKSSVEFSALLNATLRANREAFDNYIDEFQQCIGTSGKVKDILNLIDDKVRETIGAGASYLRLDVGLTDARAAFEQITHTIQRNWGTVRSDSVFPGQMDALQRDLNHQTTRARERIPGSGSIRGPSDFHLPGPGVPDGNNPRQEVRPLGR